MSEPGLPGAGPFRIFPTRSTRQRFAADADACRQCLSGACCQSEDAIYLTAFDVLRLCAYFDLSPSQFLTRFTQERFEEGPLEPYRRRTIDDPLTSVVTYLRRRSNRSFSPCIFLKYVRDPDGTPHRICSVHPARPLACREYYHHHCKTRATGELASLLAHAFEMIRDGRITLDEARAQRERLRPLLSDDAPMSAWLEYALWTEAVRALQVDEVNEEGARSYDAAAYQDPIDMKIDRLLSKQHLRLEERYGSVPHGEQLDPYKAGLSFADSPDRERLLRLVSTPPSRGLFEDGDYPFFAANRLTIADMARPSRFRRLSPAVRRALIAAAPDLPAFPSHRDPLVRAITIRRLWHAALDGADALVTFAAYVASLGQVLEIEPPGTFEWEILCILQRMRASRHPVAAVHPGFAEIAEWARSIVTPDAKARRYLRAIPAAPPAAPAAVRQWLGSQHADGSWSSDPPPGRLPDSQAAYLRAWLHATAAGLLAVQPPAPPAAASRRRNS
jgi:Fe-S-cluster containining protein